MSTSEYDDLRERDLEAVDSIARVCIERGVMTRAQAAKLRREAIAENKDIRRKRKERDRMIALAVRAGMRVTPEEWQRMKEQRGLERPAPYHGGVVVPFEPPAAA